MAEVSEVVVPEEYEHIRPEPNVADPATQETEKLHLRYLDIDDDDITVTPLESYLDGSPLNADDIVSIQATYNQLRADMEARAAMRE